MKKFDVINNNLMMKFVVTDDDRIYMEHFGTKEENYLIGETKERRFIEIEASELDHQGSHCSKRLRTPYGMNCKYVSHKMKDDDLVIITKTNYFQVETHYHFYHDSESFSSYNVVKNISNQNYTLEYVPSFYILGLGSEYEGKFYKDMFIHKATNSWHCEAQWRRRSFLEEGIFCGNNVHAMKSWRIFNTGSWSTKDYLPMAVIENEKKKSFLLAQIENNGSWTIEVGDCVAYYLSVSGPEFNHNHWHKVLKPGEEFKTCQATLCVGDSFEKVIQEITKARRQMRRPTKDDEELPAIFNDYMHALWDTQTEELIWPLVDVAEKAGCEEFVIDAGWFALGCNWADSIGAWEEYKPNFPHGGLKGTIDYIHSHNMKGGIWYEIENVGLDSEMIKKFPKEYFFQINGIPAIRAYRYALNFDNPEVYKWAMDLVSKHIEDYGLDYIKNDYNLDAGVGNEYNADSAGDGMLKHNRAFIRWLNELSDKFPDLTIENCGSGGCRMDYEMLKVCPIQSTSDQTDYRRYPYLSSAVLTAATPEQAAVWAYPVNKQIDEPVTDEVVIMNMVNAMLGRIHLASYINELTPKQFDLVKEGIQFYKDTRDFKKHSLPIFPNGISYFWDKDVVGGLIDDEQVLLCVWNTSGEPRKVKTNLSKYGVKDVKVGYPLSTETNFVFNKETGDLEVNYDIPYGGRAFICTRK